MKLLNLLNIILSFISKFSTNKSINMNNLVILNYTPHDIVMLDCYNNPVLTIKSAGVARCTTSTDQIGKLGLFPLKKVSFGKVEGLPPKKRNIHYSKCINAKCK